MTITPEEIARLRALEAGRCDPLLSHEFRAAMAFPALPRLLDEIERLRVEHDRLRVLTTCVCHMLKKDEVRADLREAVALLRGMAPALAFLRPFQEATEIDQMQAKCDALLAKHKEEA